MGRLANNLEIARLHMVLWNLKYLFCTPLYWPVAKFLNAFAPSIQSK